jgi:type VI secretion system protein ImpK
MNAASDAAYRAEVGMRDLLHDTALLVTTLASGGSVPNAGTFRERCRQLVEKFTEGLVRRSYPEDVQREALVAQCGLLDEMALRHLQGEARTAWELRPMQVERFSIHDAGRRVIDCIEARLHEPSSDVDLLECYAAILSMGFMGRYAREGQEKRNALIAALDARLESLCPSDATPFQTDTTSAGRSSGLIRMLPWVIVAFTCFAALTVWFVGRLTIDTQLVHVAQAKVAHP